MSDLICPDAPFHLYKAENFRKTSTFAARYLSSMLINTLSSLSSSISLPSSDITKLPRSIRTCAASDDQIESHCFIDSGRSGVSSPPSLLFPLQASGSTTWSVSLTLRSLTFGKGWVRIAGNQVSAAPKRKRNNGGPSRKTRQH